jgi:hypothetical protein
MSQDPNADHRPDPEQPYSVPPPDPYASPDFYSDVPPPPDSYGAPPPPPDPYNVSGTPPPYAYGGVPPVPGYAAPQPEYGYEVPSTPLPLAEAIRQLPRQYIRVVTQPSTQTFAAEMGKAAWNIIWVQLIGYAIIATLLSLLNVLINPMARSGMGNTATLPPGAQEAILWSANIGVLILVPLGFFINQGITYLVARAFNGGGTFVRQGYTALLAQVPLGLVSSLLNLIPILGTLVVIGALIYDIVLNVFSIMAVHRLSGGKASAVVLLPIGILILLACVLGFVLAIIVGVMAARYR